MITLFNVEIFYLADQDHILPDFVLFSRFSYVLGLRPAQICVVAPIGGVDGHCCPGLCAWAAQTHKVQQTWGGPPGEPLPIFFVR